MSPHPLGKASLVGSSVSCAIHIPTNSPSSALSYISCLSCALLLPTVPVPTYLVMSNIRFANPFHVAIDSWVLYLLRNAIRTASTVVAAIVRPKCATPYYADVSMKSLALLLISVNVPKTKGLKSNCLKIASNGPTMPSAVAKCSVSFLCKFTKCVFLTYP